ncbi:TolC family protein [Pseudomonas sp. BGr12]|uniref:TolC family protein n=1 Tax=Pseudomonas denitrificans TaxID=43306 RepID=A0A9X7R7U4_PSEDE|nr:MULTISPECIES: TolC family protein [Pseudomonadaceae]MBD9500804.1 TolC family protein [Pseudomonas sp. PDM17]MBD9578924.1 TolC family protein [Pseudomonas sp. PDM23]MBD9674556.1 TolC family protein [Pseudomonas sp. PDM21]MDL2430403.1 TolC family protein [Pseudomonas sp. BJa5]QEY75936.1 TolC family protein [Pseudomonas denitrificans (nom. rej.)]
MLLALLLWQLPSGAQAREIGIEDALQAAASGNPELAASGREIGIAQGLREQAGLLRNPTLSWDQEGTDSRNRTTTIGISQPLELGGKRGARVELAERGQDVAALSLQARRNQLRGEVIAAFYTSLRAQERERLAQQSVELAQRGVTAAEGRVRAGKAPPLEANRAQVQLAEVRLEQSRARRERADANQALAALMGLALPDFSGVRSDSVEPLPGLPSSNQLLDRLGDSAEMRLAQTRIDQGEAAVRLAKTQRIPDLDVSVGTQEAIDAGNRDRIAVIGFSLPLPLFDRNQGNILAESRRADQARDLRNATELRLRQETQQALQQWSTAQGEVNAFRQTILPSAQTAVESATRGFEMGKFGFLEVLDAQRTLITARDQYLRALAQVSDAWGRIERVYGDVGAAR